MAINTRKMWEGSTGGPGKPGRDPHKPGPRLVLGRAGNLPGLRQAEMALSGMMSGTETLFASSSQDKQ